MRSKKGENKVRLKNLIAALTAAAIISPAAVYAQDDTVYICAYYNDSGALVDAKKFNENELKDVLDSLAPEDAAKAKLFQWSDTLQPVGELIVSDYTRGAGNVLANMESTFKAPNVTAEMHTAGFWHNKKNCSTEIIMTEKEIADFNRAVLDTPATYTNDLAAVEGTYNGTELAELNANFESPAGLFLNGKAVEESYYEAIRENIRKSPVTDNMPYRFGFAVNRTVMKAYPYEDYLSDDPTDPEWDNLVSAAIAVNEPLVLLFTTADGKFTMARSQCCSGWVPTADIGFCKDKAEWEKYINPDKFLVVTGEKVYLEPSADADLNEKMLTMGTVLPLVTKDTGSVSFRLPWSNYVVKMPARNEDGSFYQKDALIPANRDVNVGYLPYTSANVVTQAFKSLGNRYGWGGMMNAQDCSSYAREVYRCFGFELPRNTTWQSAMPADVTVMSEMTDDEKKAVLDTLPAGAILIFPGHEMLYLGEDNGLYYTINDVSSLVSPEQPGVIIRPRSVVVNDLSTLRANGTTWLTNLSHAVVIK